MNKRFERLLRIVSGSLSGAVVLFWLVLALLAVTELVLEVPAFVGETGLRGLLLGALAVGGALGAVAMLRYRPRPAADEDLAKVCQAVHLCYHPVAPREQLRTLVSRPPVNRLWKGQHPGRNLVEGKTGEVEFLLVDCPRRTGWQTVAVFRGPNGALPDFRLRPRSVWDRLIGFEGLGFDESGLPEREQRALARFASEYVLQAAEGQDEAVRRLFTAEVLAFFAQRPGWSLAAYQGVLAVWQRRLDAAATAELHLDEQVVHLAPHGEAARRLDLLGTAQQIRRQLTRPYTAGLVVARPRGRGVRLGTFLTAVFHGALVGAWLGVGAGLLLAFAEGLTTGVRGASRGLWIGAVAGAGICAVLTLGLHAFRAGSSSRQWADTLSPGSSEPGA